PPQNGNFRGTMRYASIQSHKKEELGRSAQTQRELS
ncbi:MAG: hypothetical protein EZS28_046621, partial [Streblomastix strix]